MSKLKACPDYSLEKVLIDGGLENEQLQIGKTLFLDVQQSDVRCVKGDCYGDPWPCPSYDDSSCLS